MSAANQIVDQTRADVHRIMAEWFTDLLELRRLGILRHTWGPDHLDEDASTGLDDSMLEDPTEEELRRAG